ncbi:Ssb: single-stranded DNA-binding protein, helix-destabilizing [Desulfosarcina variabilis str. Montpellier]|uniref:single-stranded DNA-binding protein n=1 Tax=Desulfosarcina variabilis TaxID=2300 RepID=UPI003AFA81D2
MADTNDVRIIGNVGNDPSEYEGNGFKVASMSVATKHSWKGRDGEWNERTDWHRVSAFGKLAEWCIGTLRKGNRVRVEGRLQTDVVEDKYGKKNYYTKIVARKVELQ